MKIINIYFSPTGGTKHVADLLAYKLGDNILNIDLCGQNKYSISSDEDFAVISAPVYNGRISDEIRNRISAINGNATPCVVVAVFGNRAYDNALAELSDTANKSGFKVIAAIAAVAEHSILHQFGAGRPNEEDEAQLEHYAKAIKAKYASGIMNNPEIPGVISSKPTKDGQLVPKPSKRCDTCGLCAKNCPMKAIDINNPKKVDKSKCISCMRCVAICPQHARKVNPFVVGLISMLMKKAFITPKDYEIYL